jgi:hypothetical protein
MTLAELILLLVFVGFGAWLILKVKIAEPFREIIVGVLILFVVLYLFQSFGLINLNLRLH